MERTRLTATNSGPEKHHASIPNRVEAAIGITEMRIPSIHDDIANIKHRHQVL